MPYRFNPSARPNGYTYTTGYVLVLTGPMGLAAAFVHSDWRWAVLGVGSLIVAIGFYALLGWWRERYDTHHPDEVDFNTERVDKWLDRSALGAVRAITNAVAGRRHRSE